MALDSPVLADGILGELEQSEVLLAIVREISSDVDNVGCADLLSILELYWSLSNDATPNSLRLLKHLQVRLFYDIHMLEVLIIQFKSIWTWLFIVRDAFVRERCRDCLQAAHAHFGHLGFEQSN